MSDDNERTKLTENGEASGFPVDPLVSLPIYQSTATPRQRKQKLKWMYKQIKFIKKQQKEQIGDLVIRCGCHKLQKWEYMYRCLYCGIWYCKDCAENHFGYKAN